MRNMQVYVDDDTLEELSNLNLSNVRRVLSTEKYNLYIMSRKDSKLYMSNLPIYKGVIKGYEINKEGDEFAVYKIKSVKGDKSGEWKKEKKKFFESKSLEDAISAIK